MKKGWSVLTSGMALSLLLTPMTSFAESTHSKVVAQPVQHVLLLSVDGLHDSDLEMYVKSHPNSNLASLSNHGITYTNASTTKPSDSFPGMLSLVTGGSPNSTGVFYDDSYDRTLLPPFASNLGDKPGTEALFDESIEYNSDQLDGGGGINPDNLPRDPVTKQPVYPHNYLRVNTVFEVIKAAGGYTAWEDKHFAYDLLNGPSGKGIDDLYTPEIAANGDATTSVTKTEANDDLKVTGLLNEIDGKDHTGTKKASVPTLMGMNFQEVSVGQKLPGNGYQDANGTPSNGLAGALDHTDASIGKMVAELKKEHLYDSTMIIVTAKHGQSPIDPSKLKITEKNTILDGVDPSLIAQETTDDLALIWLTDQSKTADVVAQIEKNKDKANIKDIYSYATTNPAWPFNNPAVDSRVPDIVVQPNDGVIYTKPGKKIAEHGGFSSNDTHVAMLVSYPAIASAQQDTSAVQTMQVAPTILQTLGLDPNALQAVQKENTQVLPGVSTYTTFEGLLAKLKSNPSNEELYQVLGGLYATENDKGMKIFANGNLIDFDPYGAQPQFVKQRTMVPVRALADRLGAKLVWDGGAETITLTLGDKTMQLTQGSAVAYVNGQQVTLDVPTTVVDGSTIIPLRSVAQALGYHVGWEHEGDVSVISIQ